MRDASVRIARIWRGRVPRNRADKYQDYLLATGIPALQRTAIEVQLLREDRDNESEFVAISYWETIEAMSRFAGSDPRAIHHLDLDAEFLIELPEEVQVLTVVTPDQVAAT